jgi:alpha-beta hydrolase superfamily lysophospholipase
MEESIVKDIAWDFLVRLEVARRVQSLRPLVLIAHSLGGIVVMEALRRSSGCKKH